MKKFLTATASSVVFGLSAGAASAVSVDITLTEYDTVADAVGAWVDFIDLSDELLAFENFEGQQFTGASAPVVGDGVLDTAIGSISTIETDPLANGGSAIAPFDQAQIRSFEQGEWSFGRFDSDPDFPAGGGIAADQNQFLDSNDTAGLKFEITSDDVGGAFDRIVMILTDVDDVGQVAFFGNAAGEEVVANFSADTDANSNGKESNGDIFLLTFLFDELVDSATLFTFLDPGDGYGTDAIGVGATVPLPAAGWLLIGGLGGLAALKRRRKV